jgi:hypothetical protein
MVSPGLKLLDWSSYAFTMARVLIRRTLCSSTQEENNTQEKNKTDNVFMMQFLDDNDDEIKKY